MEEENATIKRTADCLPRMPALPRKTGTKNKVRVPSSKHNLDVRRVCINLDPSRRSNNRRDQHLGTNFLIPEHFPALSIRISDVLDDIGAGKSTVMERRLTYLRNEQMLTVIYRKLREKNAIFNFNFGSQSEGTTTPGLNSDIDLLRSHDFINIMTDWRDWEAGMDNLLMLYDELIPPQQYLLQVINPSTPEAFTSIVDERCVRKDSGQVLFSSERWKQDAAQIISVLGPVTLNGPSVSAIPNCDIVQALHVCKPLPEIQHWIDRCKGRHWPPFKILEAAQVAPSFLVPAGHQDSDYKREEWRLSPNLIERMLMFSFNITQIKCYIVLKFIKNSLFKKMVGDFITSFHCKTLMFYTIERTHPSLWKEHNIMFLLLQCLHVLRKWLRLGTFPHYIIKGVNLFDGKLTMVQQRRLLQYVNNLIKTDLRNIFHIDIDKLGCRLQACGIRRIGQTGEVQLGPISLRNSISLLLKFTYLRNFMLEFTNETYQKHSSNITFQQKIQNKLRIVFEESKNAQLRTVAFDLMYHLYALHNSMQASKCLREPNHAFIEIIRRFQYSLKTDTVSSRLKLASVLYCCGHLFAALRVLQDVEKRLHSKVKDVCCFRKIEGEGDLQVFASMISDNSDNVRSEPEFVFCVRFVRQEAHCAPYMLLFEMIRGRTEEEVAQRNFCEKNWMDCAEIDSRPFLHYLQYLTYGGLGDRTKQLHAFQLLYSCIFDTAYEIMNTYILDIRNNINMHHTETALHLLGHCYEMEGDYERALYIFETSLRWKDTNNAANWHVQRVQLLMSNLERKFKV